MRRHEQMTHSTGTAVQLAPRLSEAFVTTAISSIGAALLVKRVALPADIIRLHLI